MEESSLLDVVTRAHFLPPNRQSGGEENDGQHTQERRKRLEEQKSKIAGYIYKKYKAHPELKGMLSRDPVFFQEIKQVCKHYFHSLLTIISRSTAPFKAKLRSCSARWYGGYRARFPCGWPEFQTRAGAIILTCFRHQVACSATHAQFQKSMGWYFQCQVSSDYVIFK